MGGGREASLRLKRLRVKMHFTTISIDNTQRVVSNSRNSRCKIDVYCFFVAERKLRTALLNSHQVHLLERVTNLATFFNP